MKAKDRLVESLTAVGLATLATRAQTGAYDENESPSFTPITDLIHDIGKSVAGTDVKHMLISRARAGEWNQTDHDREEIRNRARREGPNTLPDDQR